MVLSQLKVGESCRVQSILTTPKVRNKLQYFGMTEGVKITLIRRAPFGGPIEIKIRDFYMSIRKAEADRISVVV